ncbi:hypothetical protein ACOMHN_047123 [Nucella lapillus]
MDKIVKEWGTDYATMMNVVINSLTTDELSVLKTLNVYRGITWKTNINHPKYADHDAAIDEFCRELTSNPAKSFIRDFIVVLRDFTARDIQYSASDGIIVGILYMLNNVLNPTNRGVVKYKIKKSLGS